MLYLFIFSTPVVHRGTFFFSSLQQRKKFRSSQEGPPALMMSLLCCVMLCCVVCVVLCYVVAPVRLEELVSKYGVLRNLVACAGWHVWGKKKVTCLLKLEIKIRIKIKMSFLCVNGFDEEGGIGSFWENLLKKSF